jgi:hypothetical protein
MNSKTKKRAVAVLTAILAISVGVAAYAYWTGGGTNTQSVATDNGLKPVKAVVTSGLTGLRPGNVVNVAGDFDNTANLESVAHVAGLTAAITGTDKPGCDKTWYSVAQQPSVDTPDVPHGAEGGAWSGLQVSMSDLATTNQDACKGANLQLTFTVG